VPALKYRLLPEHRELVPGNAALFYHRAIEIAQERWERVRASRDGTGQAAVGDEQAVLRWISGPLQEIPRDRARRLLDTFRLALHEAELGARRQSCNWEFETREEGIGLLLPEIQSMRSLARVVALRARLAVVDGKTDDAVYWLDTGLAMARHVSEGPTLIQGMVGFALTHMMDQPLLDLIQAPGTPSFYWALADRPRPFIDVSAAFDSERFLLEREIPVLRELDPVPWSLDKARIFSRRLREKLFRLAQFDPQSVWRPEAPGMREWTNELGMAALVVQAYPEAKRALIADGQPAAQVEAMPAAQVAALHTYRSYQQLRDDIFKWTGLPYYQARRGMDQADGRLGSFVQANLLLWLFTMLHPAIPSVAMAHALEERRLDAIQCIEAIRIYAAAHGGFPRRLEDITEAPVPLDPATGKPFDYRVEGERAELSAASPRGAPAIRQFMIHYELKLTH
jgi:hypothetical protein